MPGHKGKSLLGIEPFDITEIKGADELYSPRGIIAESEGNATKLFGTAHTYYSTEGSTLAIRAMLAIALKNAPMGKRATVLAARCAHKAFLYSAALLDFDIEWIYPEGLSHLCECNISPERLDGKLSVKVQNLSYGEKYTRRVVKADRFALAKVLCADFFKIYFKTVFCKP